MNFLTHKNLYSASSYYPELERKSLIAIFWDNVIRIIKYGRIEEFYFAYGLDIKKFRKEEDYVDYSVFMKWRDGLNKPSDKPFNYTGLLRDKFYFNLIITSLGFPASTNIGLIRSNEIFILESKQFVNIIHFFKNNYVDAFCKGIDAEDGKSIYSVKSIGDKLEINGELMTVEEFIDVIRIGVWTIEHRIIQHPTYASFYQKSVNTLRIYTVRDVTTGKIEFLPSIFRIGANGNNVDNWARGGILIRLFENGKLGKYGFYRPKYGTKVDRHPDSQIVFEDFELPFAKESFQLVKTIHESLYGIHSIGWDVAITEKGPLIVEANDNWEISANQIASYGFQKDFDRMFCGIK